MGRVSGLVPSSAPYICAPEQALGSLDPRHGEPRSAAGLSFPDGERSWVATRGTAPAAVVGEWMCAWIHFGFAVSPSGRTLPGPPVEVVSSL